MTPTEQDKELREKIHSALFADDFPILNDIEKDAVDRIVAIIQAQRADRKRVALEARIDELASVYIYHPRMAVGVLKTDRPMGEITVLQRIDELVAELKQELEKL